MVQGVSFPVARVSTSDLPFEGVVQGTRKDKAAGYGTRTSAIVGVAFAAIAFGLVLGLGARFGNRTCMICSVIPGTVLILNLGNLACVCGKTRRAHFERFEPVEDISLYPPRT